MNQLTATVERAVLTAPVPFAGPIVRRMADVALDVDDDDVLDSWLASLTPNEFEHILSFLADRWSGASSALDPTA